MKQLESDLKRLRSERAKLEHHWQQEKTLIKSGKTELAKALAAFLFDDENALVRIDMSESMEHHTVVMMASNVGSQLFGEASAASHAQRKHIMEILRQQFRPAFLNRIDEIVIFNRLSTADLDRIVDLQVARAQQRLADRHVTLTLTPRAKAFLAKEGYDPVYGARPLRRAVQKYLIDPIAKRLLDGSLAPHEIITVDQNGAEALTFKKP